MKNYTNKLAQGLDDRIKILFIIPGFGQGGAETQLLNIARNIDKKKFKVYLGILYTSGTLKKEFEELSNLGIETVDFGKKSNLDLAVFKRISRFIKNNEIDIVQAFITNHSAYIPVLFANNAIAIGGIRDSFTHENSFSDRLVHFHLPKWVTKIGKYQMISNSETAKQVYIGKGLNESKISVIPNGIDFKKFSSGKKSKIIKELSLKGKKVLIFVGRLIETKNHIALIDAFKDSIFQDKKNILLIVGEGPMRDRIENKIISENLQSQVKLLGNRKDVADILSSGQVFVFPSESEAWPNVVGEAMAASLPIVSFNAGDVKNIIDDGKNGFIVSNMNELVKKTLYLLKNIKISKKMGKNGFQKIKTHFSIEKMINQYENTYVQIYNSRKNKK